MLYFCYNASSMSDREPLVSDRLTPLALALFVSCMVSIGLWTWRLLTLRDIDFWYLNPNLFLAIIPLIPAWLLSRTMPAGHKSRLHPLRYVLFGMWLLFVPNSFYVVTDFIHLGENSVATTFDVVMLASFAINGCIIGYITLLYMHRLLEKRFGISRARLLIIAIIILVGFGIYLGREQLRLNSWDLFVQPWRLVLGLTEPLTNSSIRLSALGNTVLYAVFIGSFYPVVYQLAKLADRPEKQ